mgnify:CR=1 FL=1
MRRRDCLALAGIAALGVMRAARGQAFAEGPEAGVWFERASVLAGFTTGPGTEPPAAVVFFDAGCPHCLRLWADARRQGGALRIRWIPVVLLAPASARQGAALLRAGDPVAAMDAHARSRAEGGEGIVAESAPDADETRALRENTAMLRAMEVGSVPAILHRDRAGRVGLTVGAMPASELGRLVEAGRDGPGR